MSSLIPQLSRKAWIVLGADAVSALGNGMIIPFLVIYLRDARGFPIEQAGLMLSTVAVAGLVVAPTTGWLIDKVGARKVLMLSLSLAAIAAGSLIYVDALWEGYAWALLFGVSISSMWPAAHAFMASVVDPSQRAAVYSVHFALLNAGIGLGAIIGGLLVDASRPQSFMTVFLIDALTFVIYVAVLRFAVEIDPRPARSDAEETGLQSWQRLFRDTSFMRVFALSVVLITVGYAQLQSSFPAFATKEGGLSTRGLGIVYAVNTIVIVGIQLVVLRGLSGRRRSGAMAAVGVLWAGAWVVTAVAGGIGGGLIAVLLFVAASGIFAMGETFMQAALPALVNDLAPDDLRGRYNAAYSLTWSIGNMLGPALGGFLLGAGRGAELFLLMAFVSGAAAIYSIRLARFLPAGTDVFAPATSPAAT
ncbi:MAG: MFS transporter [Actinomycetota bacterium]|nr:MFS transporter [Actinomycetota bacterium]